MIYDMSLKNKNVIKLTLNVEMFSCRIIFAFYYYRTIDFVNIDLLQISNIKYNVFAVLLKEYCYHYLKSINVLISQKYQTV